MKRFVTDSITGRTILKMATLDICGVKNHQATFVTFEDGSFCILEGICTGRVELADAFRPLEWQEDDLIELGIISKDEYGRLVNLELELQRQTHT